MLLILNVLINLNFPWIHQKASLTTILKLLSILFFSPFFHRSSPSPLPNLWILYIADDSSGKVPLTSYSRSLSPPCYFTFFYFNKKTKDLKNIEFLWYYLQIKNYPRQKKTFEYMHFIGTFDFDDRWSKKIADIITWNKNHQTLNYTYRSNNTSLKFRQKFRIEWDVAYQSSDFLISVKIRVW